MENHVWPEITRAVVAALGRHQPHPGRNRPIAPRRRPEQSVIYFIGGTEGPVKIGYTNHLPHRFSALRHSSPVPLSVLASVEGPPETERAYHRRFAVHRLHGEWFARCPEIEAEIARLSEVEA